MKITDIELKNNPQELYDSFNNFMISGDYHVFNKLVARTLIYNSVKDIPGTGGTDISDVEKAEGYLAHKWGLTGNLPVNHPYKSSAP